MFKNENEIFCQFSKDKTTFRGVYFGFKSNIDKSSTRSMCSIVWEAFIVCLISTLKKNYFTTYFILSFKFCHVFYFKFKFHHFFYFKLKSDTQNCDYYIVSDNRERLETDNQIAS